MTAQQLKNSILQMAIEGKLVPQDPNDEPASVLLDRIRKEKEQLIKDGKLKKNKKESYIFRGADNLHYEQIGKEVRCIEDELPFEIPDYWQWDRWGNMSFKIQYGYNAPAKEKGNIKMVRISDIQDNVVIWKNVPFCNIDNNEIEDYILHNNDILFARTGGTVGKSFLVNNIKENAVFAGYLIRTVYDYINLNPKYLKYFMETNLYWSQLRKGTIATAQPNCNGQTLSSMFIPIPPLEEQNRIVNRLKMLEPLIDKYKHAEEKLYELNANIKEQLKKSILQYAIEGKLVSQDPNDEPASVLLDRIRKEKQKLIDEGKIKKDKNESIIYRRDNSYYEKLNYKELCIDVMIPFVIPDSWSWSKLGTCLDVRDGTHDTPRYVFEGVPLVTSKNLSNGQVDFSSAKLISREDSNAINSRSKVDSGDILYAMIGSIGNPVLYQGNDDFSIKNIALFKCIPNGMNMEYVYQFLVLMQEDMKKSASGGVQAFVPLKYLRNYLIPVPPINEQKRICDAIGKTLSFLATL